jgi:hypothetical protein
VAHVGEQPAFSPSRLAAWLSELGRVAPGLFEAHVPGNGIGARMREQLIVTVADANECRFLTWTHGAWQEFLGPVDVDDASEVLLAFAQASAQAGTPLDPTTLQAMFPPAVVRSTRATVARAELGSLLANAAGNLASQLLSRERASVLTTAAQVAAVGMAFPLLVPVAVVAGALKAAVRLAPAMPEPELPPEAEANLVVHLLAEAVPSYMGHAVVRTVLLWNPLVLAIGVRMEGTAATLRIGQGRVEIVNGLRPDALLVVEGGLESLLHLAAGSILRQAGSSARRSRK